MKSFTDQLGRTINLPGFPSRMVSTVPSQTELLHHLGLENEVVGITKFCIHPQEWFRNKIRVGGTKTLDLDKIRQLRPDLIIANKEENEQAQLETLMREFPVWVSDIETMADALEMIRGVGEITDTAAQAWQLASDIEGALQQITPLPNIRTAYFIWRGPWMVAGRDTYITDLMQRCGMANVFADGDSRYPEISETDLQAADPQLILLSSEPYPFKEKHLAELQALCPNARILLVDGEMFSWYGSRMLEAAVYLEQLISSISRR